MPSCASCAPKLKLAFAGPLGAQVLLGGGAPEVLGVGTIVLYGLAEVDTHYQVIRKQHYVIIRSMDKNRIE